MAVSAEKNIYKPMKAKITKVIDESPGIKTFVMVPSEKFAFEAGQFVEVTINGIGEAPYTPSSSPYKTDTIDVTIQNAGYVTNKMHDLKKGVTLGIRGPFGNKYPIEDYYGKEVLLFGGGVGLAPLRSLLFALLEEKEKFKKIILCYGSRSPQDIIYKDFFPKLKKIKNIEVYRTVDKADKKWNESVGVATVLLDKVKINFKNSVAVVCGPPIMMRFGAKRLLEIGYKDDQIYLSMEKNMSCGFGKCGHCQLGDYFVCKDGPVFIYKDIKNYSGIWD